MVASLSSTACSRCAASLQADRQRSLWLSSPRFLALLSFRTSWGQGGSTDNKRRSGEGTFLRTHGAQGVQCAETHEERELRREPQETI
jgi:hypothetical protein